MYEENQCMCTREAPKPTDPGDHEWVYNISWQSIQFLSKYFRLNQLCLFGKIPNVRGWKQNKGHKERKCSKGGKKKKKKVQEVVQMCDRCNQNSSKMSSRVLIWVLSWQSCSIWVRDYYISVEVGGGRHFSSTVPIHPSVLAYLLSRGSTVANWQWYQSRCLQLTLLWIIWCVLRHRRHHPLT